MKVHVQIDYDDGKTQTIDFWNVTQVNAVTEARGKYTIDVEYAPEEE